MYNHPTEWGDRHGLPASIVRSAAPESVHRSVGTTTAVEGVRDIPEEMLR